MRLRDRRPLQLTGHKGGLWAAVYSPDGSRLATASIDGTVKVWDPATGNLLRTFEGHVSSLTHVPVMSLAFSPDGRHIASGSIYPNPFAPRKSRGEIKIWEVENGKELLKFREQTGLITSIAYRPDGEQIASSSINDENTFTVWNAKTGQVLHTVQGHTGQVHRLRYSPDGRLVVSSSADGTVRLWDAVTLQEVRTIAAHPAPVFDVTFDATGARLASAGLDGIVHIWDTATGSPLHTLRGHTGIAAGVAFSPDGKDRLRHRVQPRWPTTGFRQLRFDGPDLRHDAGRGTINARPVLHHRAN